MQPEVAACETTSFPSTVSALTDDAPHVQGAWSCLAPVACADFSASTPTSAATTRQTLTKRRRPQNLTGPRMPSHELERHGPRGSSSTSASPIAVRPSKASTAKARRWPMTKLPQFNLTDVGTADSRPTCDDESDAQVAWCRGGSWRRGLLSTTCPARTRRRRRAR